MKYAIQKSNWEYVVDPTQTTIDGVVKVIESFSWDDELLQYHENTNIDKIYPSLDVQDESKEGVFFCAYVGKNEFEVSFLDPEKRPKGKIKSVLDKLLNPGGNFYVFKGCDAEKVIHLLNIWYKYTDLELLIMLRNDEIQI